MILLQVAYEYAEAIGIYRYPANPQNKFNPRNLSVFMLFVLFTISTSALLIFDANSYREFEEGFFAFIAASFTNVGLLINILKSRDIFRLVDNFEKTIETRK